MRSHLKTFSIKPFLFNGCMVATKPRQNADPCSYGHSLILLYDSHDHLAPTYLQFPAEKRTKRTPHCLTADGGGCLSIVATLS
mmetsp:Transcript_22023/g.47263  ORF Transcript_22023/g.47263 Transcript_22023/m.47263 type:complete len:83 (+) Transcript_22023:278-526(+)